jgi:Zn-dependent protease with chaperone function
MKKCVCETLAKMSWNIIDFITLNCWFISSMDDAWAFTLTGNDLKGKHLIFLSDDLLREDNAQIQKSIAHEIGHVILGHRNSILERQSKKEIRNQERQADAFAKKFNF